MIKIEHLAIWVNDLEAMKSFYTTHFGATAGELYVNPKKNFQSYFLSFGNGPRLELMQMPGLKPSENNFPNQTIGMAHFAISVGSKEKVDSLTQELRGQGVQVIGEPRTTGDGYYESVILDPEGNAIEITV
jgi:Lactoylglutathione lyase and related lyases